MEEIELRSEETRHFMNDIPPILTRIGTVLIVLIIIALGIAAYKIPYPISIEVEGTVKNKYKLEFFVPPKYLYILDEEKTAFVTFEGSKQECQILLRSTNSNLLRKNNKNYFVVYAPVNGDLKIYAQQKVHARIIIENKTLWQQFFMR